MNNNSSPIEMSPRLAQLLLIAGQRSVAYQRGFQEGYDCVSQLNFPPFALDVIAYVQGYAQGTYIRVSENSGDYLTF